MALAALATPSSQGTRVTTTASPNAMPLARATH